MTIDTKWLIVGFALIVWFFTANSSWNAGYRAGQRAERETLKQVALNCK